MCLTICEEVDDQVKQRLEQDGKIIAYKVVEYHENTNTFQSPFRFYVWEEGVNKRIGGYISSLDESPPFYVEKDVSVEYLLENKIHDAGIHVFLNKKDAIVTELRVQLNMQRVFVIEVECHKDHFIAAGYYDDGSEEATFTQVFVKELPKCA